MAYHVASLTNNVHQYPFIALFLQSGNSTLPQIKQAFNDFLPLFSQQLEQLPESVIEQLKTGTLAQLTKAPENIYVEANDYIADWFNNKMHFDSKAKRIAAIKATNKRELINLYKLMFLANNSLTDKNQHLLIQVKGSAFAQSDFYHRKSSFANTITLKKEEKTDD